MDQPGKKKSKLGIVIAAAACVIAVAVFAFSGNSSNAKPTPAALTFAAASGPLTISVSEAGTIKSRNLEVIKSDVEGQTTILFLVPEGTRVKKGDLVVELDASKLQDQRIDKQIAVQNAEANFIRAREALEVAKNQAQADVAKSELDYQFASEDLAKYENGDYPLAVTEADAKQKLAENELERATEKAKQSKELFAKNFTSLTEVQADDLAQKRAELDLVLAKEQVKLLKDFTYKRRMTELKSAVEQARLALERVKRKASADIVQGTAELKAKESEFDRQKTQLAKILKQIERTRLYAPTDGLAVYATTGQTNFRSNAEPLAEGATVRERQDLIYLPTSTSVMAEVKVHESSLDKVRAGLPVRVMVDALPGKVFPGKVAKIAPLPDGQSVWMNPDLKVYNTEIHLDVNSEELRTGMSCRAEIIAEQHEEATYVPVQAVLRIKGKPTVYVVNDEKPPEPREIELGLDNNRMAHIIAGLQPGERVMLNPPLADAAAMNAPVEKGPVSAAPKAPSESSPVAAKKPKQQQPQQPGMMPVETAQPISTDPPKADGQSADASSREGRSSRNLTPEQREERRKAMENMTPEQREERRKQFENMSPEDREKMRQQWQQRRNQNSGGGGGKPPEDSEKK